MISHTCWCDKNAIVDTSLHVTLIVPYCEYIVCHTFLTRDWLARISRNRLHWANRKQQLFKHSLLINFAEISQARSFNMQHYKKSLQEKPCNVGESSLAWYNTAILQVLYWCWEGAVRPQVRAKGVLHHHPGGKGWSIPAVPYRWVLVSLRCDPSRAESPAAGSTQAFTALEEMINEGNSHFDLLDEYRAFIK